jgi:hypothetical protein
MDANRENSIEEIDSLSALTERLVDRFGEVMGDRSLAVALNYPSETALRRACERGQVEFPVFRMPHRHGRYALTMDVADYLWSLRESALLFVAPHLRAADSKSRPE